MTATLDRKPVVASWSLLGSLIAAGIVYLLRDPTPRPGVVSIVAHLDTVATLWPILFGAAAILLTIALTTRWALVVAHVGAAASLAAYAAALWFGAAATGMAGSWITAAFSTSLAIHAMTLARSYARRHAWTQR